MEETITKFYDAFSKLDAALMCSCYHEGIVFEDPAFGVLKGDRARAMWQMLCESQKNKAFKVEVSQIKVNKHRGYAHWEAYYIFSKTGRKVHNKIDATFEFKDGLIINHKDNFNLHRWAHQAMGIKGLLFGGTEFFRQKLKRQTNGLLDAYIKEKKPSFL
jgi:ketosteroid isomerase-like protein